MTISLTFAIGSALAAVAGVLLCSAYPTLMPTTGSMPGIKAFTAAVFGGILSLIHISPGALCRLANIKTGCMAPPGPLHKRPLAHQPKKGTYP